jgi:nickel-type superoxide dismutase maturation protease
MEPTMSNGEWWVVRRTRSVRAGDVVLLEHPLRPHALVIKRIERAAEGGWWVLGDNADASEDSRQFGVVPTANVVGRLWFRYGRA